MWSSISRSGTRLAPRGRLIGRFATTSASQLFGLPPGASAASIKIRYIELAKETHPDAVLLPRGDGDSDGDGDNDGEAAREAAHDAFLAVQAAFEELMAAAPKSGKRGGSSSASSARGGEARRRETGTGRRAGAPYAPPERTLGEVLCARLDDEPEAVAQVWAEAQARSLAVTELMADLMFKACAAPGGGGMPLALKILREASASGRISQAARTASLVSLLTWCREEELDATFDVVNEVREEDRTPEVLAALSASFSYFPSGASF